MLTLGSGGVSMFAVHFAHAAGARIIATSSSDEKLAAIRGLGASDGINYAKQPDWEREVLRLTTGAASIMSSRSVARERWRSRWRRRRSAGRSI